MIRFGSTLAILLTAFFVFVSTTNVVFATSTSATSTFIITALVAYPEDDPPPGGGGPIIPTPTEVSFAGFAYPGSVVTILKDGQPFGETNARLDSRFDLLASNLTGGVYLFSIYAKDIYNNNSTPDTHTISVTGGARTTVNGIVVPPTVSADKSEVKQGDPITISGQGMQDSVITIRITGNATTTMLVTSSVTSGLYQYVFNTASLALGTYGISVKVQNLLAESSYSQETFFIVGENNVEKKDFLIGDVNYDDSVNIADFSIAGYWYKRTLSEEFLIIEADRLNGDGRVDLRDFSLMAYYWTG